MFTFQKRKSAVWTALHSVMRRSFVISIKTLPRAGWSLIQQRWNLTLLRMISGLHKGDAVVFCLCALADRPNLSWTALHAAQEQWYTVFSLDSGRGKSQQVLCRALSFSWTSQTCNRLAVESFPSSANAWRSLICGMSASSDKINHVVVMPFNQGAKNMLCSHSNATYGIWMHQ